MGWLIIGLFSLVGVALLGLLWICWGLLGLYNDMERLMNHRNPDLHEMRGGKDARPE